jgi:hypothetical protein
LLLACTLLAHAPGRFTPADVELMRETIRHLNFENAKWGRSGLVQF